MNFAAYAFYKGGCFSLVDFLLVRGLGRMCLGRLFWWVLVFVISELKARLMGPFDLSCRSDKVFLWDDRRSSVGTWDGNGR